jgi:hypothetical protein
LNENVTAFIRTLSGVHDVNRHYAEIEKKAREGRASDLVAIAASLENGSIPVEAQPWVLEAVFGHIVRSMALAPSIGNTKAVLSLLQIERKRTRQLPRNRMIEVRHAASLLAQGQKTETCLALCAEGVEEEVTREALACWVQELVVRGCDLRSAPSVDVFWSKLREVAHPLAVLPLVGLPSEQHLHEMLPQASPRGASAAIPFGPHDNGAPPVSERRVEVEAREVEAPADLTAGVSNWTAESNGVTEARAFSLAGSLDRLNAEVLTQLRLACLENATTISIQKVDRSRALAILFSAAANGGAYNQGERAAYGRLRIWHSLAALTGRARSESIEDADAIARRCEFYEFGAASDWFRQIAWDLGIACLNEARTGLTVLAATDED